MNAKADKLDAALWCVHKILANRRPKKSAKLENIVGEMNAVLELEMILKEPDAPRGQGG